MLYHDSNSQLGVEDRYVSEMKAMGRDAKPTQFMEGSPNVSPRSTVLHKGLKNRNTKVSVFPSYGVQGSKDVYSTTNQIFTAKKTGVPLDFVERSHFRQVYDMKTYMEEMLKAKNMRGEKK